MRNVFVLVKRVANFVASATGAVARGLAEMLDALVPRPEARLVPVPVRVRRDGRSQRHG